MGVRVLQQAGYPWPPGGRGAGFAPVLVVVSLALGPPLLGGALQRLDHCPDPAEVGAERTVRHRGRLGPGSRYRRAGVAPNVEADVEDDLAHGCRPFRL